MATDLRRRTALSRNPAGESQHLPYSRQMSERDLIVGGRRIPGDELSWTFGTSGGPGGQHANRSNTRAELHWRYGQSEAFESETKARIGNALRNRIAGGILTVSVDESRSQFRNRALARQRLAALIEDAARPPKTRRKTRPTRGSKQRRLDEKRQRSNTKRLRGKVTPE